ncbi:TPA: DmsC/YnfH family molybdoenzyme membrane anchor subunit [Photobacterium damselae]
MLWSDWPLLLSSVLAQLAIGAFLFLGGAILTGKLCFGQNDRVQRTLPGLWFLLFASLVIREVTLMFSQTYVAKPIGTETLFAISFFALVLTYWFAEKQLMGNDTARKILLSCAIFMGCAYFVVGIMLRSNHLLVAMHFVATTLCGGALLAHALLVKAEHKVTEFNTWLPFIGAGIALLCLVLGIPQLGDLATQANQGELGPFVAQVISLGLLIAAVGVWFMPLLTKSKPVWNVMAFAIFLIFLSSYGAAVGY